MKGKNQSKQIINAWGLLGIYALFLLMWSLHHFIAPEHHHETKICRHAPNEKHLHSDEYSAADCSICQLAPTLAELPALQLPVFSFPELIPAQNNFGESTCLPISPFSISQSRAPPVSFL